ncbi:CobW family GTP-binding protein [Casimicrobium huifangae]|jgi:G3E family GTPase|uniref:CobW family GTP-binding protein n=1 Tax=Casimicrobium huifangae TaxID=2591109 RepID=UPI002CD9B868|nr:GTP-binding protein [Casimicrobium huifangae]HQA35538.1 GTP-binding protein [Casimicrobium huifangae]
MSTKADAAKKAAEKEAQSWGAEPTGGPIPVTILTGFLGAGKTTLLNRILRENHGEKIAVIENEFGEEGVDNEILADTKEQIVEMNNGCICCTVRGDLIRILNSLYKRRARGEFNFTRVIIETTGMADPAPVAQTFFADEKVNERYLLDAVVTVVDAKHGLTQLKDFSEAQQQVAFADRLLVSKTDVTAEEETQKLMERLRKLNVRAPIKKVNFGETPIQDLLDIRGFNLNAILEIQPDFLTSDDHEHHDEVHSFVIKSEKPLDVRKVDRYIGSLINLYGEQMLRYKGILYIKGEPRRVVFQGVHMMAGFDFASEWPDDAKKESTIVFIGRKLPEPLFRELFEDCIATDETPDDPKAYAQGTAT